MESASEMYSFFLVNFSIFSIWDAYYYIFRSWNRIENYLTFGPDSGLSRYNPVLLGYKNAIKFAKEFKTIDDVIRFQKKELDKKMKSDEHRKQWLKSNIPVVTKEIL